MTVHQSPGPFGLVTVIGSPAQVRDRLRAGLPAPIRARLHNLTVDPCDERGRRCAAWQAHHYRIHAYFTSSAEPLGPLEGALLAIPGVYETHRIGSDGRFDSLRGLRVQVIALIAAPDDQEGRLS